MSEEKLPISEVIDVIQSETIYKTEKWWCAVILAKSFGRKQILYYLWIKKNGQWKRKQKATIPSGQNWQKVKEVIEKFQGMSIQ